jgi:hypothetical protein
MVFSHRITLFLEPRPVHAFGLIVRHEGWASSSLSECYCRRSGKRVREYGRPATVSVSGF